MKKYLGKSVLYSVNIARMDGMVFEGTVSELSPSGNYVQIDGSWYGVDKVNVLEVLEELPKPAPQPSSVVPLPPPAPAPAADPAPAPPPAPEPAPAV